MGAMCPPRNTRCDCRSARAEWTYSRISAGLLHHAPLDSVDLNVSVLTILIDRREKTWHAYSFFADYLTMIHLLFSLMQAKELQ